MKKTICFALATIILAFGCGCSSKHPKNAKSLFIGEEEVYYMPSYDSPIDPDDYKEACAYVISLVCDENGDFIDCVSPAKMNEELLIKGFSENAIQKAFAFFERDYDDFFLRMLYEEIKNQIIYKNIELETFIYDMLEKGWEPDDIPNSLEKGWGKVKEENPLPDVPNN